MRGVTVKVRNPKTFGLGSEKWNVGAKRRHSEDGKYLLKFGGSALRGWVLDTFTPIIINNSVINLILLPFPFLRRSCTILLLLPFFSFFTVSTFYI